MRGLWAQACSASTRWASPRKSRRVERAVVISRSVLLFPFHCCDPLSFLVVITEKTPQPNQNNNDKAQTESKPQCGPLWRALVWTGCVCVSEHTCFLFSISRVPLRIPPSSPGTHRPLEAGTQMGLGWCIPGRGSPPPPGPPAPPTPG